MTAARAPSARRRARRAPRAVGVAVTELARQLEPATPLARVHGAWGQASAMLPAMHGGSPGAMRNGVLTVLCDASVWAQELALIADDVVACVNAALGEELVRELRTRTA